MPFSSFNNIVQPWRAIILKCNKMLSYRRDTVLQGGLVMAQSGRLELGDINYRHNRSIFNHCDVTCRQSNRIQWKKAK